MINLQRKHRFSVMQYSFLGEVIFFPDISNDSQPLTISSIIYFKRINPDMGLGVRGQGLGLGLGP